MKLSIRFLAFITAILALTSLRIYGQDRQLLWVDSGGGPGRDRGQAIAFDGEGNIVIAGNFEDEATFNNQETRRSAGNRDVYVAKYSPGMAALIWVVSTGGSGDDRVHGIAIDSEDNIVITGRFRSDVMDFGNDVTLSNTNVDFADIFLAKYNADGQIQWARRNGGNQDDRGLGVDTDGTEVVITGYFQDTATFGSGNNQQQRTSEGSDDIFLAKYNGAGTLLWLRTAGGPEFDDGQDVAVERGGGDIYVTGFFSDNASFDANTRLSSAGRADIFVARYEENGDLRWARRAGGPGGDLACGVVHVGGTFGLYVTGTFTEEASFEHANGEFTLNSRGQNDIFIANLFEFSGNTFKVVQAGGTGRDEANDISLALADITVTGLFENEMTFLDTSVTSAGEWDAYLAELDLNLERTVVRRFGSEGRDDGLGVAGQNNNIALTGFFAGNVQFDTSPISSVAGSRDLFVAKYGIVAGPGPTVPTNVTAIRVSPTRVDLTWTYEPNDEDSFDIKRADSTGAPFKKIARNLEPGTRSYTDNTVSPDTLTYIYRVEVSNPDGTFDSDATPQRPIMCVAEALDFDSIQLTWKDNSTIETGFKIARSTDLDADFDTLATLISPNNGQDKLDFDYLDETDVAANTTYYYRIFAYRQDSNNQSGCGEANATTPPLATPVPLNPVAPAEVGPGDEFAVDINIGTDDIPVNQLRVVSFEVRYSRPDLLDYVGHELGDFMAGAPSPTVIPDDTEGKISASVFKTTGSSSGNGTVLRISFRVADDAPIGETLNFSFDDAQANNLTGDDIALELGATTMTIRQPMVLVWPGDADNNGLVNVFDINSIVAIHWNRTGFERPDASLIWSEQPCPVWDPVEATYADCDGNGTVAIFDINAISVNFGKEQNSGIHVAKSAEGESINRALNVSDPDPPLAVVGPDEVKANEEFSVDIEVGSENDPVSNLRVVSFELDYTNTAIIDYVDHTRGPFLANVAPTIIEQDSIGKISASVFRTTGSVSGHGVILTILFSVAETAAVGDNAIFSFSGIQANREDGSSHPLTAVGHTVTVDIEEGVDPTEQLPVEFALLQNYPNPFNPETKIVYEVPRHTHVRLEIVNLQGQLVRLLINEQRPPGSHQVIWDGISNAGTPAPSGVYIYRLIGDGFQNSKKLILLR